MGIISVEGVPVEINTDNADMAAQIVDAIRSAGLHIYHIDTELMHILPEQPLPPETMGPRYEHPLHPNVLVTDETEHDRSVREASIILAKAHRHTFQFIMNANHNALRGCTGCGLTHVGTMAGGPLSLMWHEVAEPEGE